MNNRKHLYVIVQRKFRGEMYFFAVVFRFPHNTIDVSLFVRSVAVLFLSFSFFLHFFSIRSLHSFATSDEMVVAHSIFDVTAFSAISFHKNISLNRIEARRFNIISPAFAVGPVRFMWSSFFYFDLFRLHINDAASFECVTNSLCKK